MDRLAIWGGNQPIRNKYLTYGKQEIDGSDIQAVIFAFEIYRFLEGEDVA